MADLVAQFGLDDRDFERGLQRSERAAVSSADRIFRRTTDIARREAREQQTLAGRVQQAYTRGWAAVEKAITSTAAAGFLVARSVGEYGERFSYARGQAEDLAAAVDRFKTSLGRDLSGAGGGGLLASIIDQAGRAREGVVNLTGDLLRLAGGDLDAGGKSAEIGKLAQRLEAQDLFAGRAATAADERLALAIREAEARGAAGGAAELRIQRRRRETNRRLAGLDIDPATRDELREREFALIEREERDRLNKTRSGDGDAAEERSYRAGLSVADRAEELRVRERAIALRGSGQFDIAAGLEADLRISRGERRLRQQGASDADIQRFRDVEREAAAADIARERQEREQRRRERVEGYVLQEKSLRIDTLRRQGKSTEADVLRATLEAERRIAQIRADDLLTVEQRARFIEAERGALGEEIEFLQRSGRRGATRSIASGVGGDPLLRRQVLGAGVNVAQMQLKEAKTANRHLAAIEDRVGVYA